MSTDAVTQAQDQDTFDVLSFISGTAYPVETVTIYTDSRSASELLKVNQERLDAEAKNFAGGEAAVDLDEFDDKIDELSKKIKDSTLTFELRGLPPGLVQELYAFPDDAEDSVVREAENKLIANTIVRVTNSKGATDERVWDEHAVEGFRKYLKEGEFAKIVKGVVNVNFNAAVFDQATDAGFLGGSTDLA